MDKMKKIIKNHKALQMLEIKSSTKKSSSFLKVAINDKCYDDLIKAYFHGGDLKVNIEVTILEEQKPS